MYIEVEILKKKDFKRKSKKTRFRPRKKKKERFRIKEISHDLHNAIDQEKRNFRDITFSFVNSHLTGYRTVYAELHQKQTWMAL